MDGEHDDCSYFRMLQPHSISPKHWTLYLGAALAMARSQSADENKIVPTEVNPAPPENDNKPFATAKNGNVIDNGLQRGLKNRHLVMISFGGVVGASIW
jgi:amino acid permease